MRDVHQVIPLPSHLVVNRPCLVLLTQFHVNHCHVPPAVSPRERRGRVTSLGTRGNAQVVTADVPLAEMVGYATALRSVTQGRANYSMQFARYTAVPQDLQDPLVQKIRGW